MSISKVSEYNNEQYRLAQIKLVERLKLIDKKILNILIQTIH